MRTDAVIDASQRPEEGVLRDGSGEGPMTVTAFDTSERRARADYGSFGKICAGVVPRLLDAAGIEAGMSVLDVGTGTGTAAAAACGRGAEVRAVDAEPSMVTVAARNVPTADVCLAVLPELPFADDAFDAVIGNFVLNNFGRPLSALRELRRVRDRAGGSRSPSGQRPQPPARPCSGGPSGRPGSAAPPICRHWRRTTTSLATSGASPH
ncbi:class I SAM-dependent methyltransferase [Streptomyces sp. NC-S4]